MTSGLLAGQTDDVQESALDPKLHGAIELLEDDTIVVNVQEFLEH